MNQNHVMVVMKDADTLVNKCLSVLVKDFGKYELKELEKLPKHLNRSLLRILSKRGLLIDDNIQAFINDTTKVLELSECGSLSDKGLQKVSVCTNLVKLDLNSNETPRTLITSDAVSSLVKSLRHLRTLLLRRCVLVDDSAVEQITRSCLNLSSLNIGDCPLITDKSLQSIGKYSVNLKSLNVSGSKVTDQGIFSLVTANVAKTLEEVHITNCKQIGDESIECILMHCSKIKYLLFHGCPKLTEASRLALEEYMSNSGNQKINHLTWTIY